MGCWMSPTGQRDRECGQRMLVRVSKAGFRERGRERKKKNRERDTARDTET